MVPFESLGTVSYLDSAATMAVSCTISEISETLAKNCDFFIPLAFDAPVRGSLSEYCHTVWCGYPMVKSLMICLFFSTGYSNVTDGGRMDGHDATA